VPIISNRRANDTAWSIAHCDDEEEVHAGEGLSTGWGGEDDAESLEGSEEEEVGGEG
jgi:hypothetical protein